MSTKVKGEAIKEGSIPLSALAEDAKIELDEKYGLNTYLGHITINNPEIKIGIYYPIYIRLKETVYSLRPGTTIQGDINVEITYNENGYVIGSGAIDYYGKISIFKKYNAPIIPTPDWNAQEGEAGYINNKPFGAKLTELDFEEYDGKAYTYLDHELVVDGDFTLYIIDGEGNIYITPNDANSSSIAIGPNGDSIGIELNYQDLTISFSPDVHIDEDTLNWCKSHIYHCKISKLDGNFISDTVLKTTPQTFSDEDKNQALANLGIDPVVWKYMCEPYVIFMDKPIPDELRSIIINGDGDVQPIIKNICVVGNYDSDELLQIETIKYIFCSQIYTEHNFLCYDQITNAFKLDE